MMQWLTLTVDLAALLFWAEYWFCGRWPQPVRLLLAAAAESVLYGVAAQWNTGVAFMAGMIVGAVCYLCVGGKQGSLPRFQASWALLGGAAAFLPLVLCQEAVWDYAVWQAVLLFCGAITPLSMGSGQGRAAPESVLPQQTWADRLRCLLPCTVLPLEAALLLPGQRTILWSLVVSTVCLAWYLLALCFQREWEWRVHVQRMNRALMQWQRESRDYMNTIRSQRHDFNLHLHGIAGLISSGDYERCAQYVQQLVAQANDVNDIMPVSDPVVGSMLYNMREKARKQGTDILYHITYDMEDILCNGFECNKIIGNLLQNALDAMQTPEQKAYGIRLSILKRRGNTVILSENRFDGDPNTIARVFDPGYSTKKGHEGIGLSMVLRTVERYGGQIYPEFEAGIIRFVVHIPNQIHLSEGEKA
jgi:signal transduction histidine kinase